MLQLPESQKLPLEMKAGGVIRVQGSRVTLDTIVAAFLEGASAEEIVEQYSTLQLGDVYAIIAYYLRRRSEVEAYLQERERSAQQIRQKNEGRFDPKGLRDRLLARRSGQGL